MKRKGGVVRREQRDISQMRDNRYIWGAKSLFVSCILTAFLLFILAWLVLVAGLTEKIVSIAIIIIYVTATFTGGFMAAKKAVCRKFLWGLCVGLVYFLLLLLVSAVKSGSVAGLGDSLLTTMLLCGAGGMLGGMLR